MKCLDYRSAHLKISKRGLGHAFLFCHHGSAGGAVGVAFFDGVALIMDLLAFGYGYFEFYHAVFVVDLERNYCKPFGV